MKVGVIDGVVLVLAPILIVLVVGVWGTREIVLARRDRQLTGSFGLQLALVWLLPVFGGLFVVALYRAERKRWREHARRSKDSHWDPIGPNEHVM